MKPDRAYAAPKPRREFILEFRELNGKYPTIIFARASADSVEEAFEKTVVQMRKEAFHKEVHHVRD